MTIYDLATIASQFRTLSEEMENTHDWDDVKLNYEQKTDSFIIVFHPNSLITKTYTINCSFIEQMRGKL